MSGTHFTPHSPATLAIEDRDYPEWHRGRERYGVWLIDADIAPLRARVEKARAHLSSWLSPHWRAPHITLFVCGFLVDASQRDDDIDRRQLDRQRDSLLRAALPRFTLRIGGLDSFDSAAFLRVEDPGDSLSALRHALAHAHHEIRQSAYVPHLTVGLYRDAFDKQAITQSLAAFEDALPIELSVDRIHFATYAACELGGPLALVETVLLA